MRETSVATCVGDRRFLPHLVLHEPEAWVFAAHAELGELYDPATAPSKRLLRYQPGYVKVTDGPLAVAELGIDAIRAQCPHTDAWLAKLVE
ncbi:DUF4276 family protein [Nocardia sp. NEAU-G5]|uniref:DUF4276 family protein n=1 Tax=Nocardia albiluteola TaxID=2842303 RepID=A0ABS6B0W8_9NOCA|nr:DUF4276 family protein [Nocardia albiluteola]MBU3063086.1 DUF4276 family protein [Nocardia albiluteola]